MPRPKGSKNKTVNQKIDEMIEEIKELPVDEKEKTEAIDQLDDLLSPEKPVVPHNLSEFSKNHFDYSSKVGNRKALGKDPVTGEIVFAD